MLRRVQVTIALAVAFAGCAKKQPPAPKVTPPTAQEAEAFGKEFAKNLSPCNAIELDNMIDTKLLLTRALAGRSMHSNEVDGINRGMGGLGKRLCQELGAAANVTATLLHTPVVDGAPQPLIRVLIDDGVNYYQLELDKRGGNIQAADMYIFLSGEKMSESLGRVIDALRNSPTASSLATVTRMKQLMLAKDWHAAMDLYKALPADLRNSKSLKLIEVQIAAELGDDAYVAAMSDYAKAYPNDPSLALVQIDRMLLLKQYDEVLSQLDKLDKLVGGDPYLETMRVAAYTILNKPTEAIAAAKRGVAAEPAFEAMWWALLTAQASGEQYAEAIPTLEALRDKFHIEIKADAFAADARYTKLVESKPFQEWIAH